MKIIFIITILVILQLAQVKAGFNITDPECNNYLDKFQTVQSKNGPGPSKLTFKGDVSFITGTANAKVNLRYSDVEFFNDPIFFGLVKEDGKTTESVCLDLKLWKYTSNAYIDPDQVTDLPITSSNNTEKQWRYYSFTIPGNEFKTRLVETANSKQFIYKGYYAIAYYAANTDQLYYTFFFEFSLTLDKKTGDPFDTAFKPLSYWQTKHCKIEGGCSVKPDTQLKWCTDLTCTNYATPDLHLNEYFVLQQVVIYQGMTDYYLTGTEVWETARGWNKKITPVSVNNTTPGQVIIQLKADIAWSEPITFKITSTLSITYTGGRRMLVQTEYDSVYGETVIQRIRPMKSNTTKYCQPNSDCSVKPDTQLKWCTDLTCTNYAIPDLHLNEYFVLQQVVTINGMMTGYYLDKTEVWYKGKELNKKATIISVNNTKPGQTIIQLKAEIVWKSFTIKVTSILSTTQTGGRRMLVQTEYDPVTGETEVIECIKAEGADTCPTCEQECEANGFASDGCEQCSSSSFSQQIVFVFLALLLAFTI